MKRLATLFGLAVSACTSSTAVQLNVQYDDGWELSALQLSAGEKMTTTDVTHTITIEVPDEWAGNEQSIALLGMRGADSWAQGTALVTPMRGDTIATTVHLALLSCATSCVEGSTACTAGGVATCEQRADSCFDFAAPVACSSGTRCDGGACVPGDPVVLPSNSAVIGALEPTGLVIDVPTGYVFDTTSDCFAGSALGNCTPISQAQAPDICVCRADAYTIHDLELRGERALALLAWTTVTVQGNVVATPGVGEGATSADMGNAGGSYGTLGGGTAAPTWGTAEVIPLRGGMRGQGPDGGRGGGALQMTADQMIRIEGTVDVGGGGATTTACTAGLTRIGSGGGSGGSLLLESRHVDIVGGIATNGGGGGAGAIRFDDGSFSCNGMDGNGTDGIVSSTQPSSGGNGRQVRCSSCSGCSLKTAGVGGSGGDGSVGDAGGTAPGDGYTTSQTCAGTLTPYPGGGGGGAGRIRINTAASACGCTGVLSPSPTYGLTIIQ